MTNVQYCQSVAGAIQCLYCTIQLLRVIDLMSLYKQPLEFIFTSPKVTFCASWQDLRSVKGLLRYLIRSCKTWLSRRKWLQPWSFLSMDHKVPSSKQMHSSKLLRIAGKSYLQRTLLRQVSQSTMWAMLSTVAWLNSFNLILTQVWIAFKWSTFLRLKQYKDRVELVERERESALDYTLNSSMKKPCLYKPCLKF